MYPHICEIVCRMIVSVSSPVCALLDVHVFFDFCNANFLPLLVLTALMLYLVKKYYKDLV